MPHSAHFRPTILFTALAAILMIFAATNSAQTPPPAAQNQVPQAERPKIRAITFFITIDRAEYQAQIAEAYKSLRFARTIFESRGYVVQNLQIATQPFPEYSRDLAAGQALAFFQQLDEIAAKDHIQISIGPAMYHLRDSDAEADRLATILLNTKFLSGSLVVADKDGLHGKAARAAARIIRKLSEGTPNSQGDLRFAALAMVEPLTPSFPAAYVDGFGHQFAIELQSANVVNKALNSAGTAAPNAPAAQQRLTDALAEEAYDIDGHAGRVDGETGWAYVGIDLSPEPSKDDSIGAALESLSGHQAGSPEAIAAAKTIRKAILGVSLKQVGFGAVPLAILADRRLAQRYSEGHLGIDTLLDYFAAGTTGLDAVPLPGDVSDSQLELIIVNAASQAYRSHRPLQLRLIPVAGKVAGDRTDFDDPLLANVTLQPLNYPRGKQ
jgi:uncharacterized protein (UPF0210 family)